MNTRRKRRRRAPRRPRLALAFDFHKALFAVPNLFTLSSIFCGFYAIILATGEGSSQRLYGAGLAVFFGIFFDGVDGRVARLTRTQSSFGVQLDSLADEVTFGVAPAIIVYKWALSSLDIVGALIGFVYAGCGAIRLARFNVMADRPGSMKHFLGAPIPLAAGVLVSLVMLHQKLLDGPVAHPATISALMLIVSYLMVSNVRYRTFKQLKLDRRAITISIVLAATFLFLALWVNPELAFAAGFWGYLMIGLVEEVVFFRRRRREQPVKPAQAGQEPPETPKGENRP